MTGGLHQQYGTNSRGVISVGGRAPARIFGPARIQDCSDWQIVFHLVLICVVNQSAMPCRSDEEQVSDGESSVHLDMIGPDGNWVSKRARQNQAGFNSVASPVRPQIFDGLTGRWTDGCR